MKVGASAFALSERSRRGGRGTVDALAGLADAAGLRLRRHAAWVHRDTAGECLIAEFVPLPSGRRIMAA